MSYLIHISQALHENTTLRNNRPLPRRNPLAAPAERDINLPHPVGDGHASGSSTDDGGFSGESDGSGTIAVSAPLPFPIRKLLTTPAT